jgi:hypothetical protein
MNFGLTKNLEIGFSFFISIFLDFLKFSNSLASLLKTGETGLDRTDFSIGPGFSIHGGRSYSEKQLTALNEFVLSFWSPAPAHLRGTGRGTVEQSAKSTVASNLSKLGFRHVCLCVLFRLPV